MRFEAASTLRAASKLYGTSSLFQPSRIPWCLQLGVLKQKHALEQFKFLELPKQTTRPLGLPVEPN